MSEQISKIYNICKARDSFVYNFTFYKYFIICLVVGKWFFVQFLYRLKEKNSHVYNMMYS